MKANGNIQECASYIIDKPQFESLYMMT